MNIYSTTLPTPENGYIVGLIDYLDPTHSAATLCANETERNAAVRRLLADYRSEQIIVLDAHRHEYLAVCDQSGTNLVFERVF